MTKRLAFARPVGSSKSGCTLQVLLSAGLAITVSCSAESDSVLALATANGTTIREVVGEEATAVLVYAAATCFSCGASLPNWEALAEAKRLKVLVVLVGTLTDADRRNLRIQRVAAVEVADNPASHGVFVPSEYVVLGGRVIHQASGNEIRSRRLWRQVDSDSVRFPGTSISDRMASDEPSR